jgi:EcoRII C terminal/Restriction endonuclease EcoRII, N-terminal
MMELSDWIEIYSGSDYLWYVKRLSGNDTLANRSHQAGPYVPKDVLFRVFPTLDRLETLNPDTRFDLYIDSHTDHREIRAIWYNNKLHGNPSGGRNETRLTNFGGASSALLDPESTGAIAIFAFSQPTDSSQPVCHVWVCRHETEEDIVEDRVGPIEPGRWTLWTPGSGVFLGRAPGARSSCRLDNTEIPREWLTKFPSGEEIIRKAVELRPDASMDCDRRLLRRRDCEYEIFQSVEEAVELPLIQQGFQGIEQFVSRAQSILQRRKSRSGRSLELHTRQIFIEDGLREGLDFEHQPESEDGKSPDFLFPSSALYRDSSFPTSRLRMLAVKTTCKDRWRQILNEANRVDKKHLLTLQEGISETQFREMVAARVQLVIPAPLKDRFPASVQPHLQSLESFIADVRLLSL